MNLSDIRPGLRIVILASDDFYAFVKGWSGQVRGLNNGLVHVDAVNPDGQAVELFLPPGQIGPL